ncbi:hypothetical protein AAY473_012323 [Plecturocebus cupreus]
MIHPSWPPKVLGLQGRGPPGLTGPPTPQGAVLTPASPSAASPQPAGSAVTAGKRRSLYDPGRAEQELRPRPELSPGSAKAPRLLPPRRPTRGKLAYLEEKAAGGLAVLANLQGGNNPRDGLGRPPALTASTRFGQLRAVATLWGSATTR